MSDTTHPDSLRLRLFLATTPDDVYFKDLQRRFTDLSEALAKRLGYAVEQIIGKRDEDLFDAHSAAEFAAIEEELLRTGVPVVDREAKHLWRAQPGATPRVTWSLNSAWPIWKDGRIVGLMGRNTDITARKLAEERVQYMANHDMLTGLANRSRFSRVLAQSIHEAHLDGRELAVAYLDIDRFKQINDTLGHDAGDRLLQDVAKRLQACVREVDTVARLGGDEFVVLLLEVEGNRASSVAEKILSVIAAPFTLLGQPFRVTTSIGFALFPKDGLEEQTLQQHADIAMYHAKQAGRNSFKFYSAELNAQSLERQALEASLRQALKRREFCLHYQAKRGIGSGGITGVEALLRWESPELGTVAPMRFLPLAEETGLIVPIGQWVLQTACAQNVEWQQQGFPPVSIAVNLTAKQFFHEHLLEHVQSSLTSTGMVPSLLELEIAESLLIRDVTKTLHILTQLKALGVRIAVDDFGMGYVSVATLQQFPLDTCKIDRSFISDITGLSHETGLADAIIKIGRRLSLTVVAQGVENRSQAEFLNQHACDELQGFYFGQPLPAGEFTQLLQAQKTANTYIGKQLTAESLAPKSV